MRSIQVFRAALLRVLVLAIAASALAGCPQQPGRLIVVVRTDFEVPAQMSELVVRVGRTDGSSMQEVPFALRASSAPVVDDGSRTMPLSFTIQPRDPEAEVEIRLTGTRGAAHTPVVTQRAIVGFVPGSTRVLDMFLARSCALDLVTCTADETCVDGRCVPVPFIDPSTLPVAQRPGDELLVDAGTSDAGLDARVPADASPPDATADASDARPLDTGCTLAAPVPIAPENGALTGRGGAAVRPVFSWSAGCGGQTYELEVDDSCATPGFSGCAFPSPELRATALTTTTHQPATGLPVSTAVPVGRRYYWRVRACDGATCSAWSAVRYLDVARTASDVDGDGYPDLLVAARDQDTNAGAVFVHRGGASGPAATGVRLTATSVAGDRFGYSIAYAGDLNGDGFGDVIVGAREASNPERNEGTAHVYLGSASGLGASAVTLDNPDGDMAGHFGFSVTGAGDLDGDGYADVAIGAAAQDGLARDSGRVFVYLGGEATGVAATPSVVLDEPAGEASARFGHCVRSGGDVNGDGYADLVVGAPVHDVGAMRDAGAAFVYLGGPAGIPTAPSISLGSPQAEAYFGASLTGTDLDGDGFSDLVVGASYYDSGATTEGGAFVFYGSASGPAAAPDLHLDNPANDPNAWFGDSVAAAGDLDGDGYGDLAVGALFANAPENDEGNVYVYLGGAAGIAALPDATLDNPADDPTGSFGVTIGTAGDLDADGIDDLIVGAYEQTVGGVAEGSAFVFLGASPFAPGAPDATLVNPTHQASARYGWCVAATQ